jgi:hypothetical protein
VKRALAGVEAAGDLPLSEPLLEVRQQNLFDLPQGLLFQGNFDSALF